jgi:hypothetical protein
MLKEEARANKLNGKCDGTYGGRRSADASAPLDFKSMMTKGTQ